jgi:hypothetical protein
MTFPTCLKDIWLWNGTRAMIEWAEYEHELMESEEKNPDSVVCEVSGKKRTVHIVDGSIRGFSRSVNRNC